MHTLRLYPVMLTKCCIEEKESCLLIKLLVLSSHVLICHANLHDCLLIFWFFVYDVCVSSELFPLWWARADCCLIQHFAWTVFQIKNVDFGVPSIYKLFA